ncbi:MAG: DUF2235 domain-containing protein [Nitrospiraceae bacterium]
MRNIAVFIDGTTNDHTDPNPTNILRMHRLTDPSTTSLYFRGLGNEFDNEGVLGLVGRVFGGAFGAGADAKRDQAYDALSAAWQFGDNLYIFGFSRGAAIARMLAARLNNYGLNGDAVRINMLGCFDTVASFGIPGNDWNLFKDFHVSDNVEAASHAIALDETRDMFPVSLMNQKLTVREVWFRGDHSDIGGGHDLRGLSDVTLRWMIDNAQWQGLPFLNNWWDVLQEDPLQVPNGTDYKLTSPRVPGVLINDEFHAGNEVRYSDGR